MISFEIFFDDLKPEAQAELLSTMGADSAEQMNWDIYPVATIEYVTEEDEDEGN